VNVVTATQMYGRYWWMLLIRGVVAVLFGLAAIVWPGLTALVLVYLFGAFAFVDGIVAVVVSLQERAVVPRWWVLLIEGIVGILIGVLTFFSPIVTALVLLYLIATWAILTGILEIAAAFSMRRALALEWTLAIAGILSILLGILLAIQPVSGILAVVWIIGVYAIVFGVLLIIRSFQFRSAATA
jgi:uncharacterized membrane protein HdeD (DUF308 family)